MTGDLTFVNHYLGKLILALHSNKITFFINLFQWSNLGNPQLTYKYYHTYLLWLWHITQYIDC